MKNKVKNIIFVFGSFYMLITVILMITTYCNMTSTITLSSNDEYEKEIKQYQDKVNNLENSKCKNYMKTLIEKVEKDINTSEVSLKDYYKSINSDDNLLGYYTRASEECESITIEKMHEMKMPIKFLTPSILGDEIFRNYIYQYELSIKDNKIRDINAVNLIPVENNIKISQELQIINDLLQNIDWEKEV